MPTMTGKEVFPKRLRELINTTDLTIEQFASIIGVTTRAVTYYLAGKRMPRLDVASDLAGYFNVPIDYLIQEDKNVNFFTLNVIAELNGLTTATQIKEIHDASYKDSPSIAFAAKDSDLKSLKEHFERLLGTGSGSVQYAYTRRVCEKYCQNRRDLKAKYKL